MPRTTVDQDSISVSAPQSFNALAFMGAFFYGLFLTVVLTVMILLEVRADFYTPVLIIAAIMCLSHAIIYSLHCINAQIVQLQAEIEVGQIEAAHARATSDRSD